MTAEVITMALHKFDPLSPYFRVLWELMHPNSRWVASVLAALIIWRSRHTISATSLHRLTCTLCHLAEFANNVTSIGMSRDLLAARRCDNFSGRNSACFERKKNFPRFLTVFTSQTVYYTYRSNIKRNKKIRVIYTLNLVMHVQIMWETFSGLFPLVNTYLQRRNLILDVMGKFVKSGKLQ